MEDARNSSCVNVSMRRRSCVSAKVTGKQREQQKRGNLHESNIAENNGRPGLQVQIPTHGDREHLESEARQEISGQKQAIISEAE